MKSWCPTFQKTVSDSIWYECYVHKLLLCTNLLLDPAQTMWQMVDRVRWSMMSCTSTDIADYMTLSTVHHIVWAGTDNSLVFKYKVQTKHSSRQPLMMKTETIFDILDFNTKLTQLIAQEDFIVYSHCEIFRSYIFLQLLWIVMNRDLQKYLSVVNNDTIATNGICWNLVKEIQEIIRKCEIEKTVSVNIIIFCEFGKIRQYWSLVVEYLGPAHRMPQLYRSIA
jgi:hypothetical protein